MSKREHPLIRKFFEFISAVITCTVKDDTEGLPVNAMNCKRPRKVLIILKRGLPLARVWHDRKQTLRACNGCDKFKALVE